MATSYESAALVLLGSPSLFAGFKGTRGEELGMPLGTNSDLQLTASEKQGPQGFRLRKQCTESPQPQGSMCLYFVLAEHQSFIERPLQR